MELKHSRTLNLEKNTDNILITSYYLSLVKSLYFVDPTLCTQCWHQMMLCIFALKMLGIIDDRNKKGKMMLNY